MIWKPLFLIFSNDFASALVWFSRFQNLVTPYEMLKVIPALVFTVPLLPNNNSRRAIWINKQVFRIAEFHTLAAWTCHSSRFVFTTHSHTACKKVSLAVFWGHTFPSHFLVFVLFNWNCTVVAIRVLIYDTNMWYNYSIQLYNHPHCIWCDRDDFQNRVDPLPPHFCRLLKLYIRGVRRQLVTRS